MLSKKLISPSSYVQSLLTSFHLCSFRHLSGHPNWMFAKVIRDGHEAWMKIRKWRKWSAGSLTRRFLFLEIHKRSMYHDFEDFFVELLPCGLWSICSAYHSDWIGEDEELQKMKCATRKQDPYTDYQYIFNFKSPTNQTHKITFLRVDWRGEKTTLKSGLSFADLV